TGIPGVGYWRLMDSGHLVGAIVDSPAGPAYVTGLLPPSVDPFHRPFMSPDIVAPEVTLGDTIDLLAIERHSSLQKVSIGTDEYLLLENRYLAPTLGLDVDDSTHVVLGPDQPDRFEYD